MTLHSFTIEPEGPGQPLHLRGWQPAVLSKVPGSLYLHAPSVLGLFADLDEYHLAIVEDLDRFVVEAIEGATMLVDEDQYLVLLPDGFVMTRRSSARGGRWVT